MTMIDPSDPVAVAEVLRQRAVARWGGDVALAEPPSSIGSGFDSFIHLVELAGATLPEEWRRPLVVRLLPSVDREPQAHEEAAAQQWAVSMGYQAPRVLEVLAPTEGFGLPAQVMERAAGRTMLELFSAQPWRARHLVDQLARLQLDLHALPVDGWPGARAPRALVDKRLGLPRRVVAGLGDVDLTRALERAEGMAAAATAGPVVVNHGDFHPLNVVVDGESASVIDWTDAGLGPPEADVARTVLLFRIAAIAATSRVERTALRLAGPRLARHYRRTYEKATGLDSNRMRVWEALHALHGWSQVVMLHAGGFDGESSSDSARVPLEVGAYLRRRFEEALDATG